MKNESTQYEREVIEKFHSEVYEKIRNCKNTKELRCLCTNSMFPIKLVRDSLFLFRLINSCWTRMKHWHSPDSQEGITFHKRSKLVIYRQIRHFLRNKCLYLFLNDKCYQETLMHCTFLFLRAEATKRKKIIREPCTISYEDMSLEQILKNPPPIHLLPPEGQYTVDFVWENKSEYSYYNIDFPGILKWDIFTSRESIKFAIDNF